MLMNQPQWHLSSKKVFFLPVKMFLNQYKIWKTNHRFNCWLNSCQYLSRVLLLHYVLPLQLPLNFGSHMIAQFMPSILNSSACFINHSAGLINCASPFGNSQSEQCIFNALSLDFHFVILLYAKVRPHLALTLSSPVTFALSPTPPSYVFSSRLVCYFTPNLNFFVCQHFLYPL